MAQELINIGAIANDGTGDTIRGAGIKINNNFTELYARPSVASDINVIQNNISTTASNADLSISPSGTGAVSFPGITIDDNTIKATRSNDDLRIIPNGAGSLVIDGISVSGTTIKSDDSTSVNVNEALVVDGTINADTPTFSSTVSIGSTLDVTGATTLSTLTVSGATSFVGTTTVDNLTFNDNIIASSSNADINLTPGGTGVVNVSNLTIDSSINLKDNIIKVTKSNDNFDLSANGTGSVQVSDATVQEGTIDDTVIGATTQAAGSFTSLNVTNPDVNIDGLNIKDNEITATRSNDDLEFTASGSGKLSINGVLFPVADGAGSQLLQTNGSGQLSFVTSPILFDHTLITDGTATITGNSATQTLDTFSASTFRGANYLVQVSDGTNNRYSLTEINVTHDGSTAYISTFGGADNGTGDGSTVYDSLEFSADISGGNVRVRAKVNNTTSQVLKFVRRIINV